MKRFRTLVLAFVACLVAGCVDTVPTAAGPAPERPAAATSYDVEHTLLLAQRDAIRAAQALTTKSLDPAYKLMLSAWKPTAKSSGAARYLTCVPQPYVGNAEVIGPAGGVLKVGPHVLTVPPGALSKEYVFVGERPMGDLIKVDFGPEGLKFAAAATLTLDYKTCTAPPSVAFRTAYVDSKNTFLEWEPSKDDQYAKVVTSAITHFSGYIIAY